MKVSFYLKRPDSKNETSLFARISYKGIQLKYYISENIDPKYWDKDTHRAKKTQKFREFPEFNSRLDNIESTIKTTYRKYLNDQCNKLPNPDELKHLLDKQFHKSVKKDHESMLIGFFEKFISQTKNGIRLQAKTGKPYSKNTVKVYVTAFKHLVNFKKVYKKNIDFETIDLTFYIDFTEYLIKKLNLSTNAIGKNVQVIKLILSEAAEIGLHKNMIFKSRRFASIKEQTEHIYLSEKEIAEIDALDLSHNERLDKVRDLFLIGCWTGLRYSDYSKLQSHHFNDGFIEIVQTKTGDPVTIPLHPTVNRIVVKYDGQLPRPISNQKTNEYLKELGKLIPSLKNTFTKTMTKGGAKVTSTFKKWEILSTHSARRSFATNMYLQGIPSISIMAITGHRSEKAFLKYIKLTSKEHAKVLQNHWDNNNKLKAV